MSRHCIIIIDMPKGSSTWGTAKHIVFNLKKLIAFAYNNDSCVVLVKPYPDDPPDRRAEVADKDDIRNDFVLGFRPDPARGEVLVVPKKRSPSAFAHTDFDRYLREKDCDTVVVTGVETNAGVRITASDALYHACKVICISDCCAASTEFMHKAGLRDLAVFSEMMTLQEYMYKYSRVRV